MPELFEKTSINSMDLKNRFIRSATWEGMADDKGHVTPKLVTLMETLADGGVGLMITGHAYVQKVGQAGPGQLGAYDTNLISGLKKMTGAVHKKGAKIVIQLAHAGLYADTNLTEKACIVPYSKEDLIKAPCREMTEKDIQDTVEAFGLGAKLAQNAGFDGVQIHAAHGYLLSQFLSPGFNHRNDSYGGSLENRTRMVIEVLQSIRGHVGKTYPVLIKINSDDYVDDGLTLENSVKTGVLLAENGIDAIEISGGLLTARKFSPSRMGINSEKKEAYFKDAARAFRKKLNIPLILVGGIRSYDVANDLVKNGTTDYISMSRPFIREPGLINRWLSGDYEKSGCISDNRCFRPAFVGKGITCLSKK